MRMVNLMTISIKITKRSIERSLKEEFTNLLYKKSMKVILWLRYDDHPFIQRREIILDQGKYYKMSFF